MDLLQRNSVDMRPEPHVLERATDTFKRGSRQRVQAIVSTRLYQSGRRLAAMHIDLLGADQFSQGVVATDVLLIQRDRESQNTLGKSN